MHIVILGNGISGVTCARYLRKGSDCRITLVSDESEEFFSRTALMYIYMGHMRLQDTQPYEPWFWGKNRIERLKARIQTIDFQAKRLYGTKGESLDYDYLVLATGSIPNRFGWPGQDLDGVHGLYHLQDLEAMERHSEGLKEAVIVGGGLIGVEMAEMFHSRGITVHFLVRESDFWNGVLPAEESAMVSRHLREKGIDLRLNTALKHISPSTDGKKVDSVTTSTGETIPCGFVGLTTGVRPNIDFLTNTALETDKGILVDEYLQSNLPQVYAAGDCAQLRRPDSGRKSIEAVWYTGRMMGQALAQNLLAELKRQPELRKAYAPGFWFNSAKFFDIEYQVYGNVPAQIPENQDSIYWEHPSGCKSIRIQYARASGTVLGFVVMGVRYRQEVCERWLKEGAHIEDVLVQLGLANFGAEFSEQYENAVLDVYRQKTGKSLILKQKRGLPAVLHFLHSKPQKPLVS